VLLGLAWHCPIIIVVIIIKIINSIIVSGRYIMILGHKSALGTCSFATTDGALLLLIVGFRRLSRRILLLQRCPIEETHAVTLALIDLRGGSTCYWLRLVFFVPVVIVRVIGDNVGEVVCPRSARLLVAAHRLSAGIE